MSLSLSLVAQMKYYWAFLSVLVRLASIPVLLTLSASSRKLWNQTFPIFLYIEDDGLLTISTQQIHVSYALKVMMKPEALYRIFMPVPRWDFYTRLSYRYSFVKNHLNVMIKRWPDSILLSLYKLMISDKRLKCVTGMRYHYLLVFPNILVLQSVQIYLFILLKHTP